MGFKSTPAPGTPPPIYKQVTSVISVPKNTVGLTVDVVDVTDPDLESHEATYITESGRVPVRISDASNAVDSMVQQVNSIARGGNVGLLRFHGHGVPGFQSLSGFTPTMKPEVAEKLIGQASGRSGIGVANFEAIRSSLAKLTGCFHPKAQVWLMGCDVGHGDDGFTLLEKLAALWQVPVKAGLFLQYAGDRTMAFGLEGQTITVDPKPRDANADPLANTELVHRTERVPVSR